ncbi:MAG: hypothetical protein O3A46_07160, partial [Candidatus Poribacteria bacterium]|nr:hypothetical protein [Candidatus Poribacteria bacterium]
NRQRAFSSSELVELLDANYFSVDTVTRVANWAPMPHRLAKWGSKRFGKWVCIEATSLFYVDWERAPIPSEHNEILDPKPSVVPPRERQAPVVDARHAATEVAGATADESEIVADQDAISDPTDHPEYDATEVSVPDEDAPEDDAPSPTGATPTSPTPNDSEADPFKDRTTEARK